MFCVKKVYVWCVTYSFTGFFVAFLAFPYQYRFARKILLNYDLLWIFVILSGNYKDLYILNSYVVFIYLKKYRFPLYLSICPSVWMLNCVSLFYSCLLFVNNFAHLDSFLFFMDKLSMSYLVHDIRPILIYSYRIRFLMELAWTRSDLSKYRIRV